MLPLKGVDQEGRDTFLCINTRDACLFQGSEWAAPGLKRSKLALARSCASRGTGYACSVTPAVFRPREPFKPRVGLMSFDESGCNIAEQPRVDEREMVVVVVVPG